MTDELESFFHVILYLAVRFLPSTFSQCVGDFMHEYFDDFSEVNDNYYCGTLKRVVIKTGIIERTHEGMLVFHCQPAQCDAPDPGAESTDVSDLWLPGF